MENQEALSPQRISFVINEIKIDASTHSNIEAPFDIHPRQFLTYAEYDLKSKYEHHLINSLSNIKRALDCQFASLLYGFGLLDRSIKENWNFPIKISNLNKLGVVSPRTLRRINKKRNLLEHEYVLPHFNDVEDALDVAILFIAYTKRFLVNALTECEFYHKEKPFNYEMRLDYKNNFIYLRERNLDIEKKITADSENYFTYLKLFISLYQYT